MMRWPKDADPNRMKKDLIRLLKASGSVEVKRLRRSPAPAAPRADRRWPGAPGAAAEMDPSALLWLAVRRWRSPRCARLRRAVEGSRQARKLAWVTAFLTLDLVMFGAFTRLTDSGLGCPDWPGCYGHSNPLSAGEQIRAAETALPSGPVTMTKAWIEMLHRYFAMAVGFLIIVLTVLAWRRRRQAPDRSPWLATFTSPRCACRAPSAR